MFNHSKTGRIINRIVNNENRVETEEIKTKQLQESDKSMNYKRKSSRDLLNRAIVKPHDNALRLVLNQSKQSQSSILSQRQKRVDPNPSTSRKQSCNTHRSIVNIPHKTILTQSSLTSSSKGLLCQKSKQIQKKKTQISKYQSAVFADYVVKQFESLLSKQYLKLTDEIDKQGFQSIILRLTGINYLNVTKPIWNQIFEGRETNYLSILNFLLAIFNSGVEEFEFQQERPLFMFRDKQQSNSVEKKKILIRKSSSNTKINESKQIKKRVGSFSTDRNCLVFSASERQHLSQKYNYLKTQIENRLKDKYQLLKQTRRMHQQSKNNQQVTLKIHLNKELTSFKINKSQNPAEIAKRFAEQEKLDKILQNKLCFFLTKQLKNL